MAPKKKKGQSDDGPTKLREAFKKFDSNGDGKLSVDELAAVLARKVKGKGGMPIERATEEAAQIIKNHDLNGDGELSVDEFVHFWQAKTAMDVSKINGKTTVVVEPSRGQRVGFDEVEKQLDDGQDVALVRRGSQKPLDDPEVEQIILLLDPRPIFHLMMSGIADWPDSVKAKTTCFVLVPSTTSSTEALVMAEIGIQNIGCFYDVCRPDYTGAPPDGRVRFIRIDEYMQAGDAIIVAMMEAGAHYYPKEEHASMLQMVAPRDELGLESMVDALLLEPHKGWKHWVTGAGRTAEDITGAINTVYTPVLEKGVGLPMLAESVVSSLGWHAVWPSAQENVFICFNESAQTVHNAAFGGALCCVDKFVVGEEEVTPVAGAGDDDDEPPPVETINGEKNYVNSFAGGVYSPTKQPVLVVEAADLVGAKNLIGAGARRPFHDFVTHYRERCAYDVQTVVFTAASFDELISNSWLAPAVYESLENADVVIFATHAELPKVHTFFTSPKYANENVGIALCAQCVPIPVMHLFTLKSAMGQDLANGEIIAPAVTLGKGESAIPTSKFNCTSKRSPFFLRDDSFDPMVQRTLPGAGSSRSDNVTLIQPAKLISRILNRIMLPGANPTWHGTYGEEFKGIDTDDKLQEANENLKALIDGYAKLLKPI